MRISNSVEETVAAGAECAEGARAGDVFVLTGDLGAGKTHFAKGFVAALGSAAPVTSPTFALVHEYVDGRLPVYHFDFYRLDSAEAALRLDFDDYVQGDGVCLIEWGDRFPEILPPHAVTVALRATSETEREILVSRAR